MFAWFFVSALYMQRVLGYDAMQVGLAFLPGNLTHAGLAGPAKLVMPSASAGRWPGAGAGGPGTGAARAPIDGSFTLDVLPAMVLLGLGAGVAFNPMLLAAMSDVEPSRSGLALWPGQHRLHDGRRAGTGGAGQPGSRAQPDWRPPPRR